VTFTVETTYLITWSFEVQPVQLLQNFEDEAGIKYLLRTSNHSEHRDNTVHKLDHTMSAMPRCG
jgi:spermidine/putrescine-binding protein